MPRIEAPAIDGRTYSDLVAEVEELIRTYTADRWQPPDPKEPPSNGPDAGWALVRIFGRMAELVIARLNRLPDRNFLAFLDLIGTRLNPPQPARVPLTFLLAPKSPVDALVPAGTQAAAAALAGEAKPPVFETERDLVVTRSQLVAVCSREPGQDRWADYTAVATGQAAGTFQPFRGDRPIEHRLHVSHPLFGLPEEKTIELRISLASESPPWPSAVAWTYWNGSDFKTVTPEGSPANGSVRFANVPGIAASAVNGREGFWLHGRLEPPPARADGWDLACIDTLRVSVAIDRRDASLWMVPERSFANQVPLDLSRDFLPFGEKPKIGDAFYLASEDAFSKPGAEVALHIELTLSTPPAASADLMLTWEFWNSREWQLLGAFNDGTNGFLNQGVVSFTVPPALAATEANGEVRRWIRARIARGNYGVEATYVSDVFTPATFKPPSLRSVRLGYLYDSRPQPAQLVLTENDQVFADVTLSGGFTPFVPSADLHPTLYLGFERPGGAIGFANRATALFFQVAQPLYDPEAEPGRVTEEAAVVWEYWNGEAWARLGVDDETRGLTRSGLVTFIGPTDFQRSTELGRTAFWLRGRWDHGKYAVEPQLVRVLTNTTWAVHAQTIQREVLGSSRGERGQVFRTLRAPVLDGQQLEVIEPEIPSGADLASLEAEEGEDAVAVDRDAAGQPVEIRVRWHEVPDFYGSGPRRRHYVLDRMSGEVRFGDGRSGLVPPPGRNNVRMVRYQTGGGLAGNRPAGSIARLTGTVPYVAGVVQHVPAEGGVPEESLEAVRRRGPKVVRHRGRAVAADDFEDLAFEASPQVARAQALPARRDSEGGQVGLIVVPASAALKPVPSLELLAQVQSYIEARLSPVVGFSVAGPDWLQIDVRAEVVPERLDAATEVQTRIRERLRAFLHPLAGGPQGEGWAFGRVPPRSDVYALMEETAGVDYVRWLELIEWPREGGARPGRFLIFSGEHQIILSGCFDDSGSSS